MFKNNPSPLNCSPPLPSLLCHATSIHSFFQICEFTISSTWDTQPYIVLSVGDWPISLSIMSSRLIYVTVSGFTFWRLTVSHYMYTFLYSPIKGNLACFTLRLFPVILLRTCMVGVSLRWFVFWDLYSQLQPIRRWMHFCFVLNDSLQYFSWW